MHEHIVAAIVGRNEAKALGRIEPLDCSGCHFIFSKMRECAMRPHAYRAGLIRFQRCLGEGSRLGAVNKADRLFEWAAFKPSHPIKQAINISGPVRPPRHELQRDQPSRLICSSVTTRSTFSVLLLMR